MLPSASRTQLWEIPGGIKPDDHKAQSLTERIQPGPVPATLHIPVSQPGDQDAIILVQVGEHVLKGQTLARAKNTVGLPCHASSSGVIESISPRAVPNHSGIAELCITLKTDGKDQWIAHQGVADFLKLSHTQLLNLIAKAGISGLGGAGFPAHRKIGDDQAEIHTLIINACECEPFITADDALMRERAADIITGIKVLLHMLKPKRCFIGIEDNKPEARAALDQANDDSRIQLVRVPVRYPYGAAKQLIEILTGTQVATASHATESGILCQNIATVYAIARAISYGEALISRVTTCTGAALRQPCNIEVLIGTPMAVLLENCGVNYDTLSALHRS